MLIITPDSLDFLLFKGLCFEEKVIFHTLSDIRNSKELIFNIYYAISHFPFITTQR